ncbi:FAD-binding domain-containing protein [Tenacibaculum sp. 190524A02b]|uniref:FAD-binding domain-containing protein n=1 Tax=Tenacibaculum vairaonense TaxID=3137860 RepID=UPI0031FB566F
MIEFPTHIDDIIQRFSLINPKRYSKTRNFGDGAVTKLSPYISRGVISTRQVFEYILSLERPWSELEKLVQELAWRDYWQQIWIAKGDDIHRDLKHPQKPISNYEIPEAVVNASTGINAIDAAINELYNTGYMHNHMRMYVASICCNVAKSHWLVPSRWLYANLLDGDIASNQLSWQWIAGTFSNKKYFANQDNINHFFRSRQKNTFLDCDYAFLNTNETPKILSNSLKLEIETHLPKLKNPPCIENQDSLIFNYYNLNPTWHKGEKFQRILLLEPSKFKRHPVSSKCINFVLELSENIYDIKLVVGEFEELLNHLDTKKIYYKEHPLNYNYKGCEEPREWLSNVKGYFPSFFSFWKKCRKELLE